MDRNQRPILTGPRLSVLVYAEGRATGTPWLADRAIAEECCDRGWLDAAHRTGIDPAKSESVVYELTAEGRGLIAGRRG